jgi:microcystin-dependent protein
MSSPFISEIRIFSFNFPPKGWAFCNGQTLPINQNQALFSLLGTTYGGNGVTTFMLPNLQGATPIHQGRGFVLGQSGGEVNHTLISNEMPAHSHSVFGSSTAANAASPAGNLWAAGNTAYDALPPASPGTSVAMAPAAVNFAGGSQPHANLQPVSVLSLCIALSGIYPSRN